MSTKILFVGLPDGQIHHELPAYYLAESGFEVTCIGLDETLKLETFFKMPKTIKPIKPIKYSQSIIRILTMGISIMFLRKQYDILYLYSPQNIISSWIGSFGYRGKIIYHTQDFLDPHDFPVRTLIEKRVMRKASLNITNEVNRGIFLQTFYKLNKRPSTLRTTLPSNFPFETFSEVVREKYISQFGKHVKRSKKDLRLVLHIGGFSEKRSSLNVLLSLLELPENYIVIFTNSDEGSESYEKIMAVANEYNIAQRVHTMGKLTEQELFKLSAHMDVGILLYQGNDIGNIYQAPGRLSEYVGSGIKVVVPNFPALQCTIEKYGFGEVCDVDSMTSIAQAIKNIGDEQLSIETRRIVQSNFLKNYNYEIDGLKILDEIKNLSRK